MEPLAEKVIPTRYKTKISHLLSYPIGAEAISKALQDVPQFHALILRFYYWSDFGLRRGKYEVIRAEYRNHSESTEWTKFGLYKRLEQYRWEIVVQPVPRIMRHRVHNLLLEETLPTIREWLTRQGNVERQGSYVLAFFYDEKADAVASELSDKLEPARR